MVGGGVGGGGGGGEKEHSLVSSLGLNNPSLIYFFETEYVHVLMGKAGSN